MRGDIIYGELFNDRLRIFLKLDFGFLGIEKEAVLSKFPIYRVSFSFVDGKSEMVSNLSFRLR